MKAILFLSATVKVPSSPQKPDRLVSSFGFKKFTSVLSNVNLIQRSTTAPDLQTPKSSIESRFAGPNRPKIPAKGSCSLYCSDLSHNCNTVQIALKKWGFYCSLSNFFPESAHLTNFPRISCSVFLFRWHRAVILDLHLRLWESTLISTF
jgi:hypothetical protein